MKPILVIGDACVDTFVYGKCVRLCPEAPVPVFDVIESSTNLGMSGNVKTNLDALGESSTLICNDNHLLMTKTRYVDRQSNHLFLRVDNPIRASRISTLGAIDFSKYSAVIVSDYDKGFLLEEDISFITSNHSLCFVDSKKRLSDWWLEKASFVKINHSEFLSSERGLSQDTLDKIITTLGENGCQYQGKIYPTKSVEVKDLSGAGDTFLAALVSSYLKHPSITEAISFANQCAGIVVQKKGVATI